MAEGVCSGGEDGRKRWSRASREEDGRLDVGRRPLDGRADGCCIGEGARHQRVPGGGERREVEVGGRRRGGRAAGHGRRQQPGGTGWKQPAAAAGGQAAAGSGN
jgi:hypothetical protein